MITTLAERLRQAMAGPPKVTAVAIARYCGISAPSVHGWLSGKSKSIEGSNLVRTAELLKVNAKWLAEGVGPKNINVAGSGPVACETYGDYTLKGADPNIRAAVGLLLDMDPKDRRGAVAA